MRKKILLFIAKLFSISLLFESDYRLRNLKFKPGQKVYCTITHEVPGSITGCGVIIDWDHLAMSYWAFSDKLSYWYLVRMENGKYLILPEDVITDLRTEIDRFNRLLKKWDDLGIQPGDKGFPLDYKETSAIQQAKKQAFLKQ